MGLHKSTYNSKVFIILSIMLYNIYSVVWLIHALYVLCSLCLSSCLAYLHICILTLGSSICQTLLDLSCLWLVLVYWWFSSLECEWFWIYMYHATISMLVWEHGYTCGLLLLLHGILMLYEMVVVTRTSNTQNAHKPYIYVYVYVYTKKPNGMAVLPSIFWWWKSATCWDQSCTAWI